MEQPRIARPTKRKNGQKKGANQRPAAHSNKGSRGEAVAGNAGRAGPASKARKGQRNASPAQPADRSASQGRAAPQASGSAASKRARATDPGHAIAAGRKRPRGAAGAASKLQERFKAKMESGQFRWLNEQLYTTTSENAVKLFADDPSLYDVYHRGFETQVGKWPENPVEVLVDLLKELPHQWTVGDFGCGDAKIARFAPQKKIHSFDLCKTNEYVTVANSACVPLDDGVLDIAIFCLSLMGTDFERFLLEARRTLRANGTLFVAEVKSRFAAEEGDAELDDSPEGRPSQGSEERAKRKLAAMTAGIAAFKKTLRKLGFQLKREDLSNTMFVLFEFSKRPLDSAGESKVRKEYSRLKTDSILKSCKYKRR